MAWAPAAIQAVASIAPYLLNRGGDEGYQKQQVYDKGQMKLHEQNTKRATDLGGPGGGVDMVMKQLMDMLNPQSDIYKNFEKPYMDQFEQQTLPGIAERFAGAGALGGGLSSSGFGQAVGGAGANLQTNLAQMKSGMGQDAMKSILDMYKSSLQSSLSAEPYAFVNKQQGAGMAPGLSQGISNINPGAWQSLMPGGGNQSSSPTTPNQSQYPLTSYSSPGKFELPSFAQKPYQAY